ncbi:MAG: hypothetical protein Q4B23_06850 [Helcococcus sp.]|nr:hypothetical protein [Helcococcus sp.]
MRKHFLLLINGIAIGELFGLVLSILFSYVYGLNSFAHSSPAFTNNFARPLNAVLVSVILWGGFSL